MKEVDVPLAVFDLHGDMLDIGFLGEASEPHEVASVRTDSTPVMQATSVWLTSVSTPIFTP